MLATADSADFSRYGKAFQEGLVQLIFEDQTFSRSDHRSIEH